MSDLPEKINIVLPDIENMKYKFNGMDIIIKPYLTLTEKLILLSEYIDILFDSSNDDISTKYIMAENSLIIHTIDICTNININDLDINLVIENGLWEGIKNHITKYDCFRSDLERVVKLVENKKALDKSVGNILDTLAVKIMEILNKLPDLDADKIKESSDNFTKQLEELNEKIPGITKNRTINRSKKRGRPRKT